MEVPWPSLIRSSTEKVLLADISLISNNMEFGKGTSDHINTWQEVSFLREHSLRVRPLTFKDEYQHFDLYLETNSEQCRRR